MTAWTARHPFAASAAVAVLLAVMAVMAVAFILLPAARTANQVIGQVPGQFWHGYVSYNDEVNARLSQYQGQFQSPP